MRELLLLLGLTACGKVLNQGTPDGPPGDPDAPDVVNDADVDAPMGPGVPRLYAVTQAQLDFSQVSKIGLEVINLDTFALERRVDLAFAGGSAAALSPDAKTIYIADFANGEVRFHDSMTGAATRTVVVNQVRDLAINADGTKLYAAAGNVVVEIDAATGVSRPTPPLGGNNIAINLGVSPDGQLVAFSTTNGGSNPSVRIARTQDMSLLPPISITTSVAGCAASPDAVRFLDPNIAVAWDTNCDALYQVDVVNNVQQTNKTIATGRDSGSSFISSNKLTASPISRLTYALKEDGNLAMMNPLTGTFTQIPHGDTPFAVTVNDDGRQIYVATIHRFAGGGPDTLEVIDTASSNVVMPVAYTFSQPNQSVIDMIVARTP